MLHGRRSFQFNTMNDNKDNKNNDDAINNVKHNDINNNMNNKIKIMTIHNYYYIKDI